MLVDADCQRKKNHTKNSTHSKFDKCEYCTLIYHN